MKIFSKIKYYLKCKFKNFKFLKKRIIIFLMSILVFIPLILINNSFNNTSIPIDVHNELTINNQLAQSQNSIVIIFIEVKISIKVQ